MIYWHVERKSLCIYSQLKTCSASEVAAILEGLLRHETSAEIDRNYTDTHGAGDEGDERDEDRPSTRSGAASGMAQPLQRPYSAFRLGAAAEHARRAHGDYQPLQPEPAA
jgi:hypothetical protein